jgi:hypothetical protein
MKIFPRKLELVGKELSRIVHLIQTKNFEQAHQACLRYQKSHGMDFNILNFIQFTPPIKQKPFVWLFIIILGWQLLPKNLITHSLID